MTQTQTSDPFLKGSEVSEKSSEFLAHHGTKGMKWGVWNAETAARYAGKSVKSLRKNVAGFGNRQKKTLQDFVQKKKNEHAEKVESEKEKKAIRKELGMDRAQYDKLRETTLKSHDPSVVAKGMHTLTDAELKAKIDRLKQEEVVSTMATNKETRLANQRAAKSNALKANPLVGLGLNLAEAKARQILGLSGKNKNNKNNKNGNENKNGNQSTGSSQEKKRKVKVVRKKVEDVAAQVERTTSKAAMNSYANVGRKLLTDGSVRAEVLSVETIDDRK